jgi:hypothetical protein
MQTITFNPSEQTDEWANPSRLNNALAAMNANYAVVKLNGRVAILSEGQSEFGREISFMPLSDFKLFHSNVLAPIGVDRSGSPKLTSVAELWLKWSKRRTYSGVTFSPGGAVPAGFYNLFAAHAVEPMHGSLFQNALKCRRFLKHLWFNVCSRDKGHYRYLLAWMADIFQNPGVKPGVALVLRGLKGTGKSKVADVLQGLIGKHAIKVTQARHLVGNFNRHLADKLLVVAEESFWAGRKSDEGPLKDLITAPTMLMEAKGLDAVEVPSLCRIIMVTNDEWAVPASADERRYFVLDVGDKRRQDTAYFGAIDAQLTSHGKRGYRALLGLLMNLDISEINLRKVPETSALRAQRALSLSFEEEFVNDIINSRMIDGSRWDEAVNVEKAKLHNAYLDYGRRRVQPRLLSEAQFAKVVIRTLAIKSMRPRAADGLRSSVWPLPAPEEARRLFARHLRIDIAET